MRPLRLAWRNVRRNRRRAGLTVAATVFAVFLIVLHVAMNAGMHEKMVEDGVRMRSGHLVLAAAVEPQAHRGEAMGRADGRVSAVPHRVLHRRSPRPRL